MSKSQTIQKSRKMVELESKLATFKEHCAESLQVRSDISELESWELKPLEDRMKICQAKVKRFAEWDPRFMKDNKNDIDDVKEKMHEHC